jgi:polyphosphate kinase 2 (PPK2 family)
MATDVVALQTTNEQFAQALANIQHTLDQVQQQQALQNQALLNVIRGRWDAAQNGPQSVEAIVVALNPGLQGKVEAVPFVPGR